MQLVRRRRLILFALITSCVLRGAAADVDAQTTSPKKGIGEYGQPFAARTLMDAQVTWYYAPAQFASFKVEPLTQGHKLSWTGTWATSPMYDETREKFAQHTLRQIVHTSVAGHMARIHISNLFGTEPLSIEDVHIAQRSAASSIVTSADKQVLFGGHTNVTIEPGTSILSDPIEFEVPQLSDIAISMYFPKPIGPVTYHRFGFQTSYIADGDVSGSNSLSSAKTTQSYYFLTNLDVQEQTAAGSIVTLGASITDGFSSSSDANRRWPDDLAQKLADAGVEIGVLNQGISGNRLLAAGAGAVRKCALTVTFSHNRASAG